MADNNTAKKMRAVTFLPWHAGRTMTVAYALYQTPWGRIAIATTTRGVCGVVFARSAADAEGQLRAMHPSVQMQQRTTALQRRAHAAITMPTGRRRAPIPVQVPGTDFQLRVWQALSTVPCGGTFSYGALARAAGRPGAARAVGTAMAKNPVALLVPCHRVVRAGGAVGQYAYGTARKVRILQWEKTHC